jgi:hypothetical protein
MSSRHFSDTELSCRCGCGLMPTQELQDCLDSIRDQYGKPITLTCAARCPTHNASVRGALHSQHIQGNAADLATASDPALASFIEANLETFDIYIEDPASTPSWRHVQVVPPASGRRVFKPRGESR